MPSKPIWRISNASFDSDQHLPALAASPWAGHRQFGYDLVAFMRPQRIVELGTYYGCSFYSFLQAIKDNGLSTESVAIDTWAGDPHGGFYGNEVRDAVRATVDAAYPGCKVRLLQKTFDEALADVEDDSVDLLHIDGFHSYEAVSHDFETWLPKLRENGVVLFHDVSPATGFGTVSFWEDIRKQHPHFEFLSHSWGLGVLFPKGGKWHKAMIASNPDLLKYYGQNWELECLRRELQTSRLDHEAVSSQYRTLTAEHNDILADRTRLRTELATARQDINARARDIEALLKSRSWRITAPLRFVRTLVRKRIGRLTSNLLSQTVAHYTLPVLRTAWRSLPLPTGAKQQTKAFIMRRFSFLFEHTNLYRRWLISNQASTGFRPKGRGQKHGTCLVVTTPHVLSIAEQIAEELTSQGFVATVSTTLEQQDTYEYIFALCPQFFPGLYDGYFAIQLEQHVSRWFTEDYISLLSRARAIIDYSVDNIERLKSLGIPLFKLYHAPIAPSTVKDFSGAKDIDVLFYGDIQSERRKSILDELKTEFRVHVENNLFGKDMLELVSRSKIVLNIHYYTDGVLETPRICEAIGCGAHVISEWSPDIDQHRTLAEAITVVPQGDVSAIKRAIRERLQCLNQKEGKAQQAIKTLQTRRHFAMQRFFVAQNMVPLDAAPTYDSLVALGKSSTSLCLTLDETPERTRAFREQNRSEFKLVNGLRAIPGWKGCGLSYRNMFRSLLDSDCTQVTICEDDAHFPYDFDKRHNVVNRYLEKNANAWDVFSGFIADIDENIYISRVEFFDDEIFIWIDCAVSMVFNIYNRNAISILAKWDPLNSNVDRNTIDRYMQRSALRFVTVFPFLVGHRENLQSSIWGFQNTQYEHSIARTNGILASRLRAMGIKVDGLAE